MNFKMYSLRSCFFLTQTIDKEVEYYVYKPGYNISRRLCGIPYICLSTKVNSFENNIEKNIILKNLFNIFI